VTTPEIFLNRGLQLSWKCRPRW